jgi:hypothetical protein
MSSANSKENPRVAKDLSLCSFQRESKRGAGHAVLIIPTRIQEWHRTFCLCSFQRESKKGAGNVVFDHSKRNPRGVQDMSSLLIPKRIQEGYRACRL